MKTLGYYISHPQEFIDRLKLKIYSVLDLDKPFIKTQFKLFAGYNLNLKEPRTFQEKLNWLKLNDRNPEYSIMVDKYAVKDYVANIIGEEYIISNLGVWDNFDQIDFDSLPDQFVLKTSHDSGGVVFCRNKKTFDKTTAKEILSKSLKINFYKVFREWPYKNVKPRILAEEIIKTEPSEDLMDYKFFCFNGEPKFLKVDFGRFTDHHANYYDLKWNILPFGEADFPPIPSHHIEKPENFDKMIEIVKKLAKSKKFVRIDLYNLHGKIYFGEITFYPASGYGKFTSPEYDEKIGELIDLKRN